jgi:hypothetical protein
MARLTIGEMIERVPEGQSQVFERLSADPGEERFFQVWQNWDYRPGRLEWRNYPGEDKPCLAARNLRARSVTTIPAPDTIFKGPSSHVVDFYGTGSGAFFISDSLLRLIEEVDPGSLERVDFRLRAKDGELPFHAVMPRRIVEAIDTRRTTVAIKDEDYAGWYFRTVRFPEGIFFDDEALRGAASFSDFDAPGWYWSKELLDLAARRGIRGLYARSVASPNGREVVRL